MNYSDSQRVATVLEKSGYKPADMNATDLILVNMCSVRQPAVDRVLGLGKKFLEVKKTNPRLKTILTGCFLEKDRKKFQKIYDEILNIKDINRLPALLNKKQVKAKNYLEIEATSTHGPTAYVPIMTGCNNFCAYCVVPYARGREISRPAKDIICEVKNLVGRGAKEIWLLGQNVNSYKSQIQSPNFQSRPKGYPESKTQKEIKFPELLRVVNDIPGNFWIRFTSSHPKDFSDELVDVMKTGGKITPYLNLPVQAGDNKVLKKMNRPYTVAHYKNLVKKVREKIPNICLSTDIIVGFPGETKKQFENSKKLFEEIKFNMAYISEYSPRTGTASAKMKDNVPHHEKTRRKFELNEILKKTALDNNLKYVGKTVEALINEQKNKTAWVGKTKEYKTIYIESDKNLIGKFIKAKIIGATSWGLKGKLYE